MDTKDIRFFMRVYEERSINRAAKQMFITPQGLSKIIHNLEEELEASLFERTSNGMNPTESGTYFYENSRLILDKIDETKIGIRQIRDRKRKLVMGFSCGVLNVFPLQKLEEYQYGSSFQTTCGGGNAQGACGRQECKGEHAHIEVQWEEFSNQEVMDKVLKGSIDMGFVVGPVTEHGLWSRELFQKKMNAVVYEGHPFFHRESLSIRELQGEPLITLNEKYYSYHSLLQRCHDFGFTPSIVMKTMESKIIYRFCKRKMGLGIDVNIHQDDIAMEGLHLIELHDSIPWKISMVIRDDRKEEDAIGSIAELFP